MKKQILITVLSLLTLALQAQQRLSLQDCIRAGLRENYGIQISRNNEEMDKNNINYGVFMPTLSAMGTQKESTMDSKRTDAGGNEKRFENSLTENLTADLKLNWRIFDGGAMFISHNQLRQLLAVGELRSQLSVENLIAQISTGYYRILVQESLLQATMRSVELSLERYQIAKEKEAIGSLSGLELRQTKIDLNADSSRLMKQQEELRSAYINLNTLMNGDLTKQDYVNDTIQLLPQFHKNDIEALMLTENTTLQIAARQNRISEQDMKLASSLFYPTIDFSSGYSFSQANSPASISTFSRSNGFFWGFSVNVPLFNRMENIRKLRNAKIETKNTQLSFQELRLQMLGDLAQLYNSYENNLKLVNFEDQNANVAAEVLETALERYRIGDLSGLEFREFQRSYLDAVSRQQNARFEAKVSEISLMLISGQI